MTEPIPGAYKRIRLAARDRLSDPKQRHWVQVQEPEALYAYAPARVRAWTKTSPVPLGKPMAELYAWQQQLGHILTKDAEEMWIENVVRAAKDRAR